MSCPQVFPGLTCLKYLLGLLHLKTFMRALLNLLFLENMYHYFAEYFVIAWNVFVYSLSMDSLLLKCLLKLVTSLSRCWVQLGISNVSGIVPLAVCKSASVFAAVV